jgi:hypothetical protein
LLPCLKIWIYHIRSCISAASQQLPNTNFPLESSFDRHSQSHKAIKVKVVQQRFFGYSARETDLPVAHAI